MFLLDTNVIAELRRPNPHGGVVAWIDARPDSALRLSAVTIGEIQRGVEMTRKQDHAKADAIESWLNTVVLVFDVLPMSSACFREWARLMHGTSEDLLADAMIAATARVHGLTVVTRNVRDFAGFDVPTLDPFTQ